jgi:hypothetical protein
MLGDTAVAVHPEDERYRHLVGKTVDLPLTGPAHPGHRRRLRGSGVRHRLREDHPGPRLQRLRRGPAPRPADDQHPHRRRTRPSTRTPPAYRGLDRYEARKRIVADLEAQGLLEKIEDHKLMVPRGRPLRRRGRALSHRPVVRQRGAAGPAGHRGGGGRRIRFVPDNWKNTYFDWMRNIEDWCISRQIWWGHRIPAWYDERATSTSPAAKEATAQARERMAATGTAPGRGCAGYLVLLRPVALLHPGLAGADRSCSLLPHQRAGHRLRHHLLLGRPHDHDGHEVHGRPGAVPRGLHPRSGARCGRPEDVQVQGQRAGSHRHHRRHRPGIAGGQAHHRPDAAADGKAHREGHPQGLPRRHRAYGTDALRFTFCSLASTGRDVNFDMGRASTATATSATSCGMRPATC